MHIRVLACILTGALAAGFALTACNASNEPAANGEVNRGAPSTGAEAGTPEQPNGESEELYRDLMALKAENEKLRLQLEESAEHPYADWVRDNPLRRRMRDMWINCGQIIANSDASSSPDVDWLYNPALQIAESAGELEDYWQRIRDANREEYDLAKSGDWQGARRKWDEVHQACRECHDKLWAKEARGMTPEIIELWNERQTPFTGAKWGEQVFSAPPTVRKGMLKLQDSMFEAEDGIAAQDADGVKSPTLVINKAAQNNLDFWSGIRRNAEAIMAKAQERNLDVRAEYERMSSYCIKCHEATADNRGINPLPWPGSGG